MAEPMAVWVVQAAEAVAVLSTVPLAQVGTEATLGKDGKEVQAAVAAMLLRPPASWVVWAVTAVKVVVGQPVAPVRREVPVVTAAPETGQLPVVRVAWVARVAAEALRAVAVVKVAQVDKVGRGVVWAARVDRVDKAVSVARAIRPAVRAAIPTVVRAVPVARVAREVRVGMARPQFRVETEVGEVMAEPVV